MVDTDKKKELFYKIFKDICDVINIEYVTEMSTTLDYSNVTDKTSQKGLKGFSTVKTNICPLPFYHTYLNAEGTISACCVAGPWYTPPALIMGDLHHQEIDEIWNSDVFQAFLVRMLRYGKNEASDICKKCKAYLSYIYPEDYLDQDAKRIACDIENGIQK